MKRTYVPFYVVAGRIAAFIGMGLSASLGLFLLVGGFWAAGLIAAAFLPLCLGFLLLMEWAAYRHVRR